MESFIIRLKQFVDHQVDLPALTQELWMTLNRAPDQIEQIRAALNSLTQQDIIAAEVGRKLLAMIDRFQASTTPRTKAPFIASASHTASNSIVESTAAGNRFPELLKQFANHAIAYTELEEGLVLDLEEDPSNHEIYQSALQTLAAQETISREVFTSLMATLDGSPSAPGQEEDLDLVEEEDTGEDLEQAEEDDLEQVENLEQAEEEDLELAEDLEQVEEEDPEQAEDLQQVEEEDLEQVEEEDLEQAEDLERAGVEDLEGAKVEDLEQTEKEDQEQADRLDQEQEEHIEQAKEDIQQTQQEGHQDEEAVAVGTLLKDRFLLTEYIGNGGTGAVFKAEDRAVVAAEDVVTEVAVKVLNKSFREHPEAFQILQREALKTRSLAHPHIVNVYDCDRDEHSVFMTMELMHGLRLDEALKRKTEGFEFEEAKRFIVEMADALQNAHKKGVIHSDLRPGNIFLASGKIKLFDFGMARAIKLGGAETTRRESYKTGDLPSMTPTYASPEMLDNSAEPDPRDDIYAMGCISYELLTGRHPFIEDGKAVSASAARESGLKPDRISGLKSWQWHALRKCLEFDRPKRTVEVDIFLEEFQRQSRALDLRKLVAGTVAMVLIVAAAVFGWDYANKWDIEKFNALVNQGVEHELIQLKIADVQKLASDAQYGYFHARSIQNDLLDYYRQRTNELIETDDFELAKLLIDQAVSIYSDSSKINNLLNDFNAKRNLHINDLDRKLNGLLADPVAFTTQYKQLKQIWQTFGKISKDYPTEISARSVILKLEDASRRLMTEGNHKEAREMVQFALALFAADPEMQAQLGELENLTGTIENRKDRQQRNRQVATLESTLRALGGDNSLAQLQAVREEITKLGELSPDSEVLSQIRSLIKKKLDEVIEQELKAQQWDKAQTHAERFVQVLTVKERELLRSNIDNRRNEFQEKETEHYRNITRAARSEDPGTAMTYLEQLRKFDPDSSKISASQDLIGTGWLKQARIQKANKNWKLARTYVQNGLNIAQGKDLKGALQSELGEIDKSRQRAGKQLELADANRRQQLKKQRIQQLELRVRTAVSDSSLTSKESLAALELLDQLEVEDPSNVVVGSGKRQLVARYRQETKRLISANKLEQALQMSQRGFNLFPDQTEFALEIDAVKKLQAQQQAAIQEQQLSVLKDELTRLSESFDPTTDPDQLVQTLQRYESTHEKDGLTEYVRFKAAAAFVKLADSLIADARFEDARQAISEARRFDPGYAQIATVEEKVRTADLETQSIRKDQRAQAQHASMKQSFITQVQALDVLSAAATLKTLRRGRISSNDSFFATTVPLEFERAYLRLTALKASPSTLTETIDLLKTGLGYNADSTLLQDRLDIYRQAQRILTTGQINMEQASRLLARAQQQYPSEQIFKDLKLTAILKVTVEVNKNECKGSMAGKGGRSRNTCFDSINSSTKGPRLVVVPEYNGTPLVIMRYELRRQEYNDYCRLSGLCQAVSGDGNLPITNLDIRQIQGYSDWLSDMTRQSYRLPLIGEWQFAANANGTSQKSTNCGRNLKRQAAVKVDWLKTAGQNGWGLAHMVGNVQELVKDGSRYKAVGGAYADNDRECTEALSRDSDGSADPMTGFRLVRDF